MQRLLATAAAVGVASVSCGKQDVAKGAPNEKRGCGRVPTNGSGGDNDRDANFGYAVVDPMPTPAYCPGIAQLIKPSVKLAEKSGAFYLFVTLPNPTGRPDFKFVTDAPAVGYGGTVVKTDVSPDGMTVTMKLDAGTADASSASVSISVKGVCDQGPSTLSASVSWMGQAKVASPTVSVQEY